MSCPCPVCQADIEGGLEWRLVRCASCRALLLARRADDGGSPVRAYDIRGVSPRTEWRRVTLPWDADSAARLRSWLFWSAAITFAAAAALLAAAWLWR